MKDRGKILNMQGKPMGVPVFNQETVDRYLGHFLNVLRQNGIAAPSKEEQMRLTYDRVFFLWLKDLEHMEQAELKFFDENRQRIRMALQLLDQKEKETKAMEDEKQKTEQPTPAVETPVDPEAAPKAQAEPQPETEAQAEPEQPAGETNQPADETNAAESETEAPAGETKEAGANEPTSRISAGQ